MSWSFWVTASDAMMRMFSYIAPHFILFCYSDTYVYANFLILFLFSIILTDPFSLSVNLNSQLWVISLKENLRPAGWKKKSVIVVSFFGIRLVGYMQILYENWLKFIRIFNLDETGTVWLKHYYCVFVVLWEKKVKELHIFLLYEYNCV